MFGQTINGGAIESGETGRCILIGNIYNTGTINVAEIYDDYANLTADNFIVTPANNGGNILGTYAMTRNAVVTAPTRTYDASTGVLTANSLKMTITTDRTTYVYCNCNVYLCTNIEVSE